MKEKYRKKARERGRSNPILNRERAKAWALKHPEKTKSRSFSNHIKQFYNITPDDYDHMLDMQGGGCAICGAKPNHGDRRLHVDHDHATGQIRGLLCFGCNAGLGMFKDNINSFNNAIAYVAGNGKWKEMRKAFITLSGLLFSPEEIYKAVQEDDKKFH